MPSDESSDLTGRKLRDAAREAARLADVSAPEWPRAAIPVSAAEARATKSAERPRRRERSRSRANDPDEMSAVRSRLDELSGQIEALAAQAAVRAGSAPAGALPPTDVRSTLQAIERQLSALGADPAPQISAPPDNDAIRRIDRRLEQVIREGRAHPTELERRIAAVDHSLARLNRERTSDVASAGPYLPDEKLPGRTPDPHDGSFGIEQAVAEIADRQRALDAADPRSALRTRFTDLTQRLDHVAPRRRTLDEEALVAGLQDQLRSLTQELRGSRQIDLFERAVAALREELGEIARRVTEAAPRRSLQALETEVRNLALRIESGREQGVDHSKLDSVERALAEIREAVHDLAPAESLAGLRDEVAALDRRIAAVSAADPASNNQLLRELEQAVTDLRELAARAASGEALIALAEEVQALGEKLDHFIAAAESEQSRVSSVIEQRFQELAEQLEARFSPHNVTSPDLASLVQQMAGKLDRIEFGSDNAPLLDAIGQQMARLSERLEASDARLGTLEAFDRSIRDLVEGIEDLRASATAIAARAGREAALEIATARPPCSEADALRSDIDTLRHSQQQSDRSTQDSLEAVHETLERLVDRLASVETDLQSEMRSAGANAPFDPAPAPPTALGGGPSAPEHAGPGPRAETAEAPTRRFAPAERRPIDPTLPADHPLEPGAAVGRHQSASAAERIAASEAALSPVMLAPPVEAKANFIAAARRAAQTAANMSGQADARAETEAPAGSKFGTLARRLTGRRPLLLALIVLLGAGVVHVLLAGLNAPSEQPQQTARELTAPRSSDGAPVATALQATAAPGRGVTAPTGAGSVTSPPERSARQGSAREANALPERPASAPGVAVTPTISPLTIASIQLPGTDLTGSVPAAAAPAAQPTPALAPFAPNELPGSMSKRLREAALGGDPAAEYEIAARYAEGRGVPLSLEEAARWFERAANRGLAPAQYRLGSLYEKGQGVRKDADQARRLYRAAADKGNPKAMHNLAVLYAEGIEGHPDFAAAVEWFRRAAVHGIADSQYNLGILYARGLGVEQNLAESYKWFALAAQQGDSDAGKKRDDVAGRLDRQALAKARSAVQAFKPQAAPDDAVTVKPPPGGWDSAAVPAAPARSKGLGAARKPKAS